MTVVPQPREGARHGHERRGDAPLLAQVPDLVRHPSTLDEWTEVRRCLGVMETTASVLRQHGWILPAVTTLPHLRTALVAARRFHTA